MDGAAPTRPSITEDLSAWLRQGFSTLWPDADLSGVAIEAVPTADERHGDYQANAAMPLAKVLREKPRAIAERFVAESAPHPLVASMEVAGPGFINLTLDEAALAGRLDAFGPAGRFNAPEPGRGRSLVLDYSSPNVAKPMHIGHIRSTVIGAALDRLHRFLGYRVISDNHLGDWGTQFGLLLIGFQAWADREAYAQDPIAELERIYRESYARSQEDPAWLEAARVALVELQGGHAGHRELWESFVASSLGEFERIYQRLGVRFDLVRGESFYQDRLAETVDALIQAGIARESEGAWVGLLDHPDLPPCIVRKRDGGFNYAATDLATIRSRVEEFAPERIIYVTDERQQLHFRQVFELARQAGWVRDTGLDHVWFGLMRLPEGTFSTRQGNVIKLEALLDEAERRAQDLVREASPDMPEAQQREVARAVGIGAVKYADLSQNPQSLVTFTWDKAMALDGNSAPYLQYAHARARSVLDKHAERHPGEPAGPVRFTDPAERRLGLHLLRFPDAILAAAIRHRPNLLADYLFELGQRYSRFYQTLSVLRAEDASLRRSRLALVARTADVLRQGLDLLGIEAPERI